MEDEEIKLKPDCSTEINSAKIMSSNTNKDGKYEILSILDEKVVLSNALYTYKKD